MSKHFRHLCALVLTAALATGCGGSSLSYAASIDRARDLVHQAQAGNGGAAGAAAATLQAGAGCSQSEVLAALGAKPPDLTFAGDRLDAVAAAIRGAPGGRVSAADRDLLSRLRARPAYVAEQVPPPGDFLSGVWDDLTAALLPCSLPGGPLSLLLLAAEVVGILVVVGAIGLGVVGAARGWRRRSRAAELASQGAGRARTAAELFAVADRLAAADDAGGAVRALAQAVATVIAGPETWDRSPLTVREIFRTSDLASVLRPLLLQFEISVYGHRPVDPEGLKAAFDAALPFRSLAAAA